MKKIWIATLVALSLTVVSVAQSNQKDIQVVPVNNNTQNTQNTQQYGETSYGTTRGSLFTFAKPAKKSVRVGQHIQLALKLKKKAYIYIIAVSNRSNKAYMILPNRFEGYNLYRSNKHYVVPERSADYRFISDAPGTETVYVVASTYKQNFEQLLNQFGKKEVGGFRISSAKAAQTFVKDILVVPARTNKAQVEVRKLKINVR